VRIDHGVVAGAEVASVLACPRRHTVAALAADVAHLVAHLLLPVATAPTQARPRAVCDITSDQMFHTSYY
jgi:poly(3-hydroxybutyrate) depolymerase